MKALAGIRLEEVQAVYSGAEGALWELIMGQQIHIGGMTSSADLAEKAGIGKGMSGVDLCCCNGAGMRYLVRMHEVNSMIGVDATPTVISLGQARNKAEGLTDRINFVSGDVTASGLPDGVADFVWGEDAWCYVVDKDKLIAEAARLIQPGGTIAFTDWVEGNTPMTDAEAERFLRFMKFPSMQDIPGYRALLAKNNCDVRYAEDTGRFAPCLDLYITMLSTQHTYDALKIIGFDQALFQMLAGEMLFAQELAHAGKIIQGLFVARKKA
jgi:ubiquinone/menaquinone biosynthesis C-methylase UbiE